MVGYNSPETHQELIDYANEWIPGVQMDFLEKDDMPSRINWMQQHAEDIDVMYVYGRNVRDVFKKSTKEMGRDPYVEVEIGSVDQVED